MSLKTQLQAALAYVNGKLAEKGAEAASSVYDIGNKIDTVSGGVAFLPKYDKAHLDGKAAEINAFKANHTGVADFFAFTDYHYHTDNNAQGNAAGTGAMLRYLADKTGVRRSAFLGDVLSYETTQALIDEAVTAFTDEVGTSDIMIVKGNHDNNPYGGHGLEVSDEDYMTAVMSLMKQPPETTYYYRDDTVKHIRYIVLDSRETSVNYSYSSGTNEEKAFATAEMTWLAATLNSMPSGYTAVVLCHVMWWDVSDITNVNYSPSNTAVTDMMSAYNSRGVYGDIGMTADFSNAQGTAPVLIVGHAHKDYTKTMNGIIVFSVAADSYYFANARPDYVPHTVDTPAEHAVDYIAIDTVNKTIDCIRIGAGENRHFDYAPGTVGLKCGITKNLTHCAINNNASYAYQGYQATVTADTDYRLQQITVTMKGADMSRYVSINNGAAVISLPNLIGDIVITATAVEDGAYRVNNTLTHCVNSNAAASVAQNAGYAATVTAENGYTLAYIRCTMGGVAQTVTNGSINIADVTGDIVIEAIAFESTSFGTNKVRTAQAQSSTDTYNDGLGYKNNTRLTNGNETGEAGRVITGFIPYVCGSTPDTNGPTLYIKTTSPLTNSHDRLCLYSNKNNKAAEFTEIKNHTQQFNITSRGGNVYELTPNFLHYQNNIQFIRFSFVQDDGKDIIISADPIL